LIIDRICKEANCSIADGSEYFEFLKDAQILLSKNRPSISGRHAFYASQNFLGQLPEVADLQALGKQLLTMTIDGLLREDHDLFNTILIRHPKRVTLDSKYQHDLRQGFSALNRLCPADVLPALNLFKSQYQKHFENERIPLLLALDPELGIGYQTEPFVFPNPLLETVHIRPRGNHENAGNWSPVHRYLMAAWLEMERMQQTCIALDDEGLMQLPEVEQMLSRLGFSALFSIGDEGLYIETAGGANPAALIGRFTVADQDILAASKEIAAQIERLNPELIFAEILHTGDAHTDNVNRREQVWSYQLPLLAGIQSDYKPVSLRLDDLYVEISGDQVYLYSRKHQKYVIPRLTSAYNHSIDQLPLFRFLADLSYQYSRTQLSFDLMNFFPGFRYYPRVSYKQVILSRATWIIRTDDLPQNIPQEDWAVAFIRLANKNGIPQLFVLAEGDQQLVFNQQRSEDLVLLRESVRSKNQVILREYLPLKSDQTVMETASGNHYHAQFNAFLLPEEPLNFPNLTPLKESVTREQRKFIPGTEWLYLKLYVPRLSVNRLLLQMEPLLRKRFPHGKITRWFFIRYEDHAPHIRLRFKIAPEDVDQILAALRLILEDNVQQHLIREYQLDVYTRELERYQAIGIEETEEFFWLSSSFVLFFIKSLKTGKGVPTYLAAAHTVKLITEGFYPNPEDQLAYWQEVFDGYIKEFEGRQLRVDLDKKYRENSRELDHFLTHSQPFSDKRLLYWLKNIESKATALGMRINSNDDKKEYLLSLIHVHLNRIFTDQQRQQEMITYFLLAKWMRSKMARQKQGIRQTDLS
jgi:thiopeptide-type bacteriocin biosynthesis protein